MAFRLLVNEPVRQAHFGLAIYSTDGQLIWAMKTADTYKEYLDFDTGVYDIQFKIPSLPLRESNYFLKVSANTRLKQYDVWDVEPALEIVTKTDSVLPNRWQGIVNMPCEVNILPIGDK
jgi:hypothetical protein